MAKRVLKKSELKAAAEQLNDLLYDPDDEENRIDVGGTPAELIEEIKESADLLDKKDRKELSKETIVVVDTLMDTESAEESESTSEDESEPTKPKKNGSRRKAAAKEDDKSGKKQRSKKGSAAKPKKERKSKKPSGGNGKTMNELFLDSLREGPKTMKEIKEEKWNHRPRTFYSFFKELCEQGKAHKMKDGRMALGKGRKK